MSTRTRWLSSITLLCLGAGVVGGAAALFVPGRGVVRASESSRKLEARSMVAHGRAKQQTVEESMDDRSRDPVGRRYRGGMVISGTTRSGAILFSFDDGPELRSTPRLLAELDKRGVSAVFFIVGERISGTSRRARERRKLVREIASRGHLIGNHTFSHRQLTLLSDAQVRDEILRTERLLTRIVGSRPWLFRPPGGARSSRVDKIVAELGYTSVLWNMDTGDTQAQSADIVAQNWASVARTPAAREGGIILLHDLLPTSAESFARIYDRVQASNETRRERGMVLWTIVADLDAFYVPRADADASDVAPPLASLSLPMNERATALGRQLR